MRRYSLWNRSVPRESREFYEKAFLRENLVQWDAKWHTLSPRARFAFLNEVKGPLRKPVHTTKRPSIRKDQLPPSVLEELLAADFVELGSSRMIGPQDKVMAVDDTADFATRIRAMARNHLLNPDLPSMLEKHVAFVCYQSEGTRSLSEVLRKAGLEVYLDIDRIVRQYVVDHRWPEWVASHLAGPVPPRILKLLKEADKPIRSSELPAKLPDVPPEIVGVMLDSLLGHLAVFEDLEPQTLEIVVGFNPSIRKSMAEALLPRQRPQLIVEENPAEVGPEASIVVDDLRAFMLEVAGEPPRLRQDHAIFQKDADRFLEALEPLPSWLMKALGLTQASRMGHAFSWARALKMVTDKLDAKGQRLEISSQGSTWLAGSLQEQYESVYQVLRDLPRERHNSPGRFDFIAVLPSHFGYLSGDARFLGADVIALVAERGRTRNYSDGRPSDYRALRSALDRSLSILPAGIFHRLDSAIDHLVFDAHNPLLLEWGEKGLQIFHSGRLVPPFVEEREQAARDLLANFVFRRLIPLGCLQAGVDREGRLLIARLPRIDAYFGRASASSVVAGPHSEQSRVVVQPDFSIVVIGLNPAPAAELAPFCDREKRGGSHGAISLKLTRESVLRAVAHGVKPTEIVERLVRLASNEVPPNVLRQVSDWGNWVRKVQASPITMVRCPDAETADRVLAAMKRQAERLNETTVAILQQKLTAADRSKLKEHGIILDP